MDVVLVNRVVRENTWWNTALATMLNAGIVCRGEWKCSFHIIKIDMQETPQTPGVWFGNNQQMSYKF